MTFPAVALNTNAPPRFVPLVSVVATVVIIGALPVKAPRRDKVATDPLEHFNHFAGAASDDVLVLSHEGRRKVLRLQQVIQLEGTDPALPVSVTWGRKVDALTPEETQRLLAMYGHFDKRS